MALRSVYFTTRSYDKQAIQATGIRFHHCYLCVEILSPRASYFITLASPACVWADRKKSSAPCAPTTQGGRCFGRLGETCEGLVV